MAAHYIPLREWKVGILRSDRNRVHLWARIFVVTLIAEIMTAAMLLRQHSRCLLHAYIGYVLDYRVALMASCSILIKSISVGGMGHHHRIPVHKNGPAFSHYGQVLSIRFR